MMPFWCGVLHRLADRHEQLQPLSRRQAVLVAVAGERHPFDQLHGEERPAVARRPGVEHPGDVGVVHEGQRLAFRLEPGQHRPGAQPGLDQLDGHQAPDRLGLLGHPDRAHAAFADRLQQLVAAGQHGPGPLRAVRPRRGGRRLLHRAGGSLEEAGLPGVGLEQGLQVGPQLRVAGAAPSR